MKLLNLITLLLAFNLASYPAVYAQEKSAEVIELEKKAEAGDFDSIVQLASSYGWGFGGVSKDINKAIQLYKEALKMKKTVQVYLNLANLYSNSQNIENSDSEANRWYKEAHSLALSKASDLEPFAMLQLGDIYRDGKGVEKNIKVANQWFRKSFDRYLILHEQGDKEASLWVGGFYENGMGVEQDYKKAIEWYRISYENYDNILALAAIGRMYINGMGQGSDYNYVLELMELKAGQGDKNIQNLLGEMYAAEEGVSQDTAKAIKWYSMAAEAGDASALSELADIYYNGKLIPKDLSKAFHLYKKTAESGHEPSYYSLANMYYRGEGTIQHYASAIKWHNAALSGIFRKLSLHILNRMYLLNEGDYQDFIDVYPVFLKSAEDGISESQLSVGLMYKRGHFVEKNPVKAHMFFNISASNGNPSAESYRDNMNYQLNAGQIAEAQDMALEWMEKHPAKN
jgi:uncharacterized protein